MMQGLAVLGPSGCMSHSKCALGHRVSPVLLLCHMAGLRDTGVDGLCFGKGLFRTVVAGCVGSGLLVMWLAECCALLPHCSCAVVDRTVCGWVAYCGMLCSKQR
jgi:hypothetical protein